MQEPVLEVRNLKTYIPTERGVVKAVDGVSFRLYPGETLGVVGESGCGKSMTALSIMGLVPRPGRIVDGEIRLLGHNLVGMPERELRRWRGNRMAMIFQDPLATLNPVLRVGTQVTESIRIHYGHAFPETGPGGRGRLKAWLADPLGVRRRQAAWERAVAMLEKVGIPAPAERMQAYPHQLSGGMRQRVMIAIALSCNPALLLADEPTTALDVTIQAQILELMRALQEELGTSILLITHDFGVVSEVCHRVMVMYAGKVVEAGPLERILEQPLHPYTQGLLASIPRVGDRRHRIKPVEGIVPELHDLPTGCSFCPRCPWADARCAAADPPLRELAPGHQVACHKAEAAQGKVGA